MAVLFTAYVIHNNICYSQMIMNLQLIILDQLQPPLLHEQQPSALNHEWGSAPDGV
jgi:hypothetical protein